MKFWAKVRFKEEKGIEALMQAFFNEFNPQSSIAIEGKEVEIEIVFNNNPPSEIIKAINNYDDIKFNYGKAFVKNVEDETKKQVVEEVEETSEHTEQVVAEKATLQQTEHLEMKRSITETKKSEPTKVANVETVNVPQLKEIAKKSTSFEHFVKLVAKWLEIGKKTEFFERLVIVATEVEKISWKELEEALKKKGIICTQWDKIFTGQQISKKLQEYTVIPFLKIMKQYKNYCFVREQSTEIVTDVEKREVKETIPENRVKMECMPEIPHFEETLKSVDKTQPIEERVRCVLTAMGLQQKSIQKQKVIFEIANTAVRLEDMALTEIFSKANIPMEDWKKEMMTFSQFINDFVNEYDSNKKVKVLEFLKQLQEIVVTKNEITD